MHVRSFCTRLALATPVVADVNAWRRLVLASAAAGVGLLVASAPDPAGPPLGAQALAAARLVSGRMLVGAAEPLGPGADADVIQVGDAGRLGAWPGRITGCGVASLADIDACVAGGAGYIVVDASATILVDELARLAHTTDLVWFVSGVSSLADLDAAVRRGARRVWLSDGFDRASDWANRLRAVWQADPAMRGSAMTGMRREGL